MSKKSCSTRFLTEPRCTQDARMTKTAEEIELMTAHAKTLVAEGVEQDEAVRRALEESEARGRRRRAAEWQADKDAAQLKIQQEAAQRLAAMKEERARKESEALAAKAKKEQEDDDRARGVPSMKVGFFDLARKTRPQKGR